MTDTELVKALWRIALLDNTRCMGCENENKCSIHGCQIIKAAATRINELTGQGSFEMVKTILSEIPHVTPAVNAYSLAAMEQIYQMTREPGLSEQALASKVCELSAWWRAHTRNPEAGNKR